MGSLCAEPGLQNSQHASSIRRLYLQRPQLAVAGVARVAVYSHKLLGWLRRPVQEDHCQAFAAARQNRLRGKSQLWLCGPVHRHRLCTSTWNSG